MVKMNTSQFSCVVVVVVVDEEIKKLRKYFTDGMFSMLSILMCPAGCPVVQSCHSFYET